MRRMNGSIVGPRSNLVNPVNYSVKFDPNYQQYLILDDNDAFTLYSFDFTIECWIKFISTSSDQGIVSKYSLSRVGYYILYSSSSGGIRVVFGDEFYPDIFTFPWIPKTFTWYHLAVVRSGNSVVVYINGNQIGVTKTLVNVYELQPIEEGLWIGQTPTISPSYFNGYISNLRIVKNVAIYTGDFTVPSFSLSISQSPGTNISDSADSNTSLLTCNSSSIVDSSLYNFPITNIGRSSVIGYFGIWNLDELYLNSTIPTIGPSPFLTVAYLIAGSGGGGGGGGGDPNFNYSGGGGGAGGLLQNKINFQKETPYSIIVGAGGPGGAGGGSGTGYKGNNSSISGIDTVSGVPIEITALGGGRGGAGAYGGAGSGASGGGGGGRTGAGGAGTPGQGYNGGAGGGSTGNSGGGGGGGAGGPGTNGNTLYSGNTGLPGAGVSSVITGVSVTYASGGPVASRTASGPGSGGGSGGGRTWGPGYPGSSGKDGIVIFSYSTAYPLATATGTYTQTIIGTTDQNGMGEYNYLYVFTGNGTITFN